MIERHIFISYSRDDTEWSEKIRNWLRKNDHSVWIDYKNLIPGTHDWQTTIREAVNQSYAVVFLASPSSGISKYVSAELALAKAKGIPIIPIWVRGNTWVDSVPLDMVHSQHIDCRDSGVDHEEKINMNIRETLCNHLPKHGALLNSTSRTPSFLFSVWSGVDEPIAWFNLLHYDTMGQLLYDLYMEYLIHQTSFPPYTYAKLWVLVEPTFGRLFVPPEFLSQEMAQPIKQKWFNLDIHDVIQKTRVVQIASMVDVVSFGVCGEQQVLPGFSIVEKRNWLLMLDVMDASFKHLTGDTTDCEFSIADVGEVSCDQEIAFFDIATLSRSGHSLTLYNNHARLIPYLRGKMLKRNSMDG